MKKILFMVFSVVCFIIYGQQINHYDMEGVVQAQESDVLVLLDKTDNLWEIDFTDTLQVGDKVKITFDTNGTDNERIDDVITSVIKY